MANTKIAVSKICFALLGYSDAVSFVIRDNACLSSLGLGLLNDMEKYLLQTTQTAEAAGLLSGTCDNLYDWLHPHLPEDLVFYKDQKPVFISITHEKDAYFEDEHLEYLKAINFSL